MKQILFLLFVLFILSSQQVCFAQPPPSQGSSGGPGKKEDKKKDTWFRLIKLKRCPIKSCETKMVHQHNGKKFRGRKKLKFNQNPKTGELQREPVTDPKKHKKSTKVKKKHEYQKEFKLPEKSN